MFVAPTEGGWLFCHIADWTPVKVACFLFVCFCDLVCAIVSRPLSHTSGSHTITERSTLTYKVQLFDHLVLLYWPLQDPPPASLWCVFVWERVCVFRLLERVLVSRTPLKLGSILETNTPKGDILLTFYINSTLSSRSINSTINLFNLSHFHTDAGVNLPAR